MPTSRGSVQLMPCSAISPRRTKAVVNTALLEAKRMSQNSAKHRPMPAHGPLIAAMIGFETDGKYVFLRWKSLREVLSNGGSGCSSSRPDDEMFERFFMSAPAQNPRPAPVRPMTRKL